jgi:UDP:flavonoid glycosyltransferase YjiC (YdhE family)
VLFNINGSGLGHLSRCLAYARRLKGRAEPVFFSLASAIEVIQGMGFEGDYFISQFWSRSPVGVWERELAIRFGLMLEEVRPAVVVFDGTWPYRGFMTACDACRVPRRVWSNRGLHKPDFEAVPIREIDFDLVLQPGEIGARYVVEREKRPGRKVTIPPVTVLGNEELLGRDAARDALGLERDGHCALLSLGPGNLKDVRDIAHGLTNELRERGFTVAWARAPISVRDVPLPDGVVPVSLFPLVRYMRAFDVFAGAAGYNTCCEVIQSGVPSLLVPNTQVADDQARRATIVASHAGAIVSGCETPEQRAEAVTRLLATRGGEAKHGTFDLDGAEHAADEILSLIDRRWRS